jgi:lipoate-protein ligase A
MAADEVLLESAAAGTASLRFYQWTEATVSLGYFQPERVRREDERLADLPFVRRPSGGATLVHHHEVTYCLALPQGARWQTGESWLRRMHMVIAGALQSLGVPGELHVPLKEAPPHGILCFGHFAAGDLMIGPAKVVGSAQRKYRGALMQHGSILLAQSPHTPALPGIRELSGRSLSPEEVCGAVLESFTANTEWALQPEEWTGSEREKVEQCVVRKYARDSWNCKR